MGHRQIGATRTEREARQLELDTRRAFGLALRQLCADAGITRAALARAAHLSPAQVGRIMADTTSSSVYAMCALAVALDARFVLRFDQVTGPPIRDRIQALIVETMVGIAHARWKRFLEVPVFRPVRGMIDVVLHDPLAAVAIATEVHSEIRRFEQQQRWANAKADALLGGSELPLAAMSRQPPTVSRLLVLLSTETNRELVRTLSESFRVAYPGRTADAYRALTTADAPWPGPSLLWARVDGSSVTILPTPPRGVLVGR
jgi:transcriptional regulator with XRE-family HTH domain